jgi:hypothetical protein
MLAVLGAYILELALGSSRVKAGVIPDAFAGQPLYLMSWDLHVDPNGTLKACLLRRRSGFR